MRVRRVVVARRPRGHLRLADERRRTGGLELKLGARTHHEERGMGSKGSGTGAKKLRRPLLASGIGVAVLGAAFLLAPAVIANERIATFLAEGVRIPAMFALLIGALLIGLDFVLRALTLETAVEP